MKTKTKKKNKVAKTTTKKVVRSQKFESHYLAIVLIAFLLLEGILISSASTVDWQKGFAVLDVSQSITQATSDLAVVLTPVTETINNVDTFYQLAATEMTSLLDLSDNNPTIELVQIFDGVAAFYEQAATEMIALLDMSTATSWPSVAGASVSPY